MVLTYQIMKKICNPSLLSKNYFVSSNLLAKMSFYMSFFITTNKNWNLEGSYAFHKKPPEWSKIRITNLLCILREASNAYELPAFPPSPYVATPAKVSTAATAKIMFNIEFIFVLRKLLNKLIFKKRLFSKIVLQNY